MLYIPAELTAVVIFVIAFYLKKNQLLAIFEDSLVCRVG
jgi:hypothetical protein